MCVCPCAYHTGGPSVILTEKAIVRTSAVPTVKIAALPASQAVGKTVRTTFYRPSAPHGVVLSTAPPCSAASAWTEALILRTGTFSATLNAEWDTPPAGIKRRDGRLNYYTTHL